MVPASFEELTGWGTASPVQCPQAAAIGVGWGLASGGALVASMLMTMMMTEAFYVYETFTKCQA